MQDEYTVRECLSLSGEPFPATLDILAITAGEGNGWLFSEAVLRASLSLWDGVETFVDHAAQPGEPRSVRDLAGICSQPRWDNQHNGIRIRLRTSGPSGALVESVAQEWLASPEPRPRVGFSADVLFSAREREVSRIIRVFSLDVVINPARGGAFLQPSLQEGAGPLLDAAFRPMQPVNTEVTMQENIAMQFSPAAPEGQAVPALPPATENQPNPSAYLLETRLNAAHLPQGVQQRLRRQFSGHTFESADLEAAIEDARGLLAELQGGSVVAGSGRVSEMLTSEERLQAAVDDLLDAPRDERLRSVKVERLGGLRELYITLTGDVDLHGVYDPQRMRLATTATMPALVKNAMNKIIANEWDQLGRAGYTWWEKIVRVEHFDNLNAITGVLVGEIGGLPQVSEGGTYTALPIADSEEAGNWSKYGGYLPLTLELIDRDQVGKLKSYPRRLASAALRNISRLVSDVFLANSGQGPTMKDNGYVFRLAFNNLGGAALSSAAWEEACGKVYAQPLLVASGEEAPILALDPKYLLVPRSLRLPAMQILYPQWERQASIFSENMQRGEMGDVIVVPDFSDTDDWAAVVDPRLAPAIYIGERFGLAPEIFISGDPLSPAMFTNDETRLKVRHFISVFVADHRPLFKSNVSA